ncbi:hypothetical protein PV721_04970 [Streptomyces sp. MB09-01]|uniref:hypothetical protein n=1 Tax=Streptomyces sp. MB09-01 TaxID=3028666 RepID=UPI0029A34245|nr:hypothetical protein [Streptomyces sp. MB09-01]MDX3533726.1 hypothetical protein [Streptomyces sp. MB09-01]
MGRGAAPPAAAHRAPAVVGEARSSIARLASRWSSAGKRAGLTAQSLQVLTAMLRAAGEAAGHGGYRERSGATWAEVRAMAAAMPDPEARLVAEVLIWALGLQLSGEPLRWVAMEQSANLPEEVREAVSLSWPWPAGPSSSGSSWTPPTTGNHPPAPGVLHGGALRPHPRIRAARHAVRRADPGRRPRMGRRGAGAPEQPSAWTVAGRP